MFDPNNNIKYYKNLYNTNGNNISSIGWNRDNQALRFDSLLSHLRGFNCLGKIADVGSGFSDLYFYLTEKNIKFDFYIGFEIIDDFYNVACSRINNANNIQIFNTDYLNYDGIVDTIVGSGIFGMGNGNDYDMLNYVDQVIVKSCATGNKAIAFNFLSANSNKKSSVYSFQPCIRDLVDIVSKYSSRYIFDHSYSPYEFTLTIFINQKINDKLWYEV